MQGRPGWSSKGGGDKNIISALILCEKNLDFDEEKGKKLTCIVKIYREALPSPSPY